jgi:uncharacterized protein (TIGR03067 family)
MKFFVLVLMLFLAACGGEAPPPPPSASPPPPEEPTLDGTWVGHEVKGRPGEWTVVFDGDFCEVAGPDDIESYSGPIEVDWEAKPPRLVLEVEECSVERFVGQKTHMIFQLRGDTLTLAGTAPGSKEKPTGFIPGKGVRVFQGKRQ